MNDAKKKTIVIIIFCLIVTGISSNGYMMIWIRKLTTKPITMLTILSNADCFLDCAIIMIFSLIRFN